ncbi:hypothetical protein BJX61DRAFT_447278 [Aspergillus egyptiacus]|nr:hypothetical protein BJX61DRAFT_447278 [Aspergillus egyptiacus]
MAQHALWYYFLLLVAGVNAAMIAAPRATAVSQAITGAQERHPAPTAPVSLFSQVDVQRRDATTTQGAASICGYYEGSLNSALVCYYEYACVFHAPNTDFPGMVGCCPTTSATRPCQMFSTCYDGARVSATPGLLASPTDAFAMFCTFKESPYCHTRTWPDLNVADVACTHDSSAWLETMYTAASFTDDDDQLTATISVSWVADEVLWSLRSVSATTSTTSSSARETASMIPENSASDAAAPTPDAGDSEGSSTPVGTIVGAVVGGVVGLVLVIVVAVWIWRRRKRNSHGTEQETVKQVASHDAAPELQGGNATERHELMAKSDRAELPAREVRYELE